MSLTCRCSESAAASRRFRRRGAVIKVQFWGAAGFGERFRRLCQRLSMEARERRERAMVVKVFRSGRGYTAPEIAAKLPVAMGYDQIERLLNQPLAAGTVVGWGRRECTVTGRERVVYWLARHLPGRVG